MVDGTTGIITTVAGTGAYGYSGQGGPATSALLNRPSGICLDSKGNMYISDTGNFRLRMVSRMTGVITTIAGTGKVGFSGDLGPAVSATITRTQRSTVDPVTGVIYIADSDNHRIRMVVPRTGVISTVAGNGLAGYSGDGGLATLAQLYEPSALSLDSNGNLYIADTNNNCIRMVIKSTGVIITVAGVGFLNAGYSGDGGLAASAVLSRPSGVIVNTKTGTIYISDTFNSRVREVKYGAAVYPTQRKREKGGK
jgi:sugar lactone lactonase YvrE